MSVGVSYLSQRKVVKTTPTMKLQSVLEEACAHFKMDSSCCRLLKGKSRVDLSLPYRFANLPNNTTLELEVFTQTQVGAGSKLATARVALSINGRSGESGTFPVTHSLNDIVLHYINEGVCPDILAKVEQSCPEVIYLQSRFGVESFVTTTLSGLGLAGSSARLQLRFKEEKSEPSASVEDGGRSSEAQGKEGTQYPPSVFTKSDGVVASDPSVVMSQVDLLSPMSTLKSMLENNFDAVNKPAVIFLSKYLFNIFANPDVEKYRTVYVDNKAFREKVACAQGFMEFLVSAGFETKQTAGRPSLVLPVFSQTAGGGAGSAARRFETSCHALEQALVELQVPSEDRPVLQSPEELQKARAAAGIGTSGASGGAPAPEFNPYKTFVRRVADGSNGASIMPSDGSSSDRKSATQERLEALAKRRRELEGDLEGVRRKTRLYLPGAAVAAAKDSSSEGIKMEVEGEEDDDKKPDSRLLAQSLRGKLSNDDAPLTTAATRAVLKAQSETVYSQTAIKVRFPDKATLTGMFHPRHKVRDIYNWVLESLHTDLVTSWRASATAAAASASASAGAGAGGGGKKRSGNTQQAQTEYPFELYTAPPRTVLTVDVTHGRGVYNRWEDEEDDEEERESLLGRKLVPAAQIMLSWTAPSAEAWVNSHMSGSDSNKEASTDKSSSGYFSADVLHEAVAVDQAAAPAISASLFPQGKALVEISAKSSSSSTSHTQAGAVSVDADGKEKSVSSSSSSSSSSSKKGKPSWFKL